MRCSRSSFAQGCKGQAGKHTFPKKSPTKYPAFLEKGFRLRPRLRRDKGVEIPQVTNTPKPTFRLFSHEKKFFPSPGTNQISRKAVDFGVTELGGGFAVKGFEVAMKSGDA